MIAKCSLQSTDTPLFQSLDGLRQLADTRHFKAWFLDQFGVLHDGKQPYPGAISTLEKLANSGAQMVIISNSSRRASTTMEKMKSLGFDTSVFAGAITSGELTHQYLQRLGITSSNIRDKEIIYPQYESRFCTVLGTNSPT